ncbi:DUF1254 domain-containing protein [Pseudomonas putida]|uniref:DUF1254 domain-containing protein n=1 Tax=Pseudomonas putida TaxID=303 RepID=UPI00236553B8|nr:DUF1254 domain-containing protein [Pseudomonas putida]MDD2050597.1 DUF1254 domain-containing protein [Pseudomonas putida]
MTRIKRVLTGWAAAGLLAAAAQVQSAQAISEAQAYEIAKEAYFFAYPIVTMDATRRQVTNVPDNLSVPMRAPVNQFAHARAYPKADTRDVVRLNFDTLYSPAWLDVAREPVILSVPGASKRLYLLPMLDMWTEVFAVVGTRTLGERAANFAIVAPGWNGTLPPGVEKIVAPTSSVWILGRTQTNGPADYAAVHALQDGYTLTPLSRWGKSGAAMPAQAVDPAVDDKTPPVRQVMALDGVAMLGRLATLMQAYPAHASDYPMLLRLQQIGLQAGEPFSSATLSPARIETLNTAARDAQAEMIAAFKQGLGTRINGWSYSLEGVGTYGTAYRKRAIASMVGLGINLVEDTVSPSSFTDGDGQPYSGANRYVLHFDKHQLPPVDAFWSVTLYDNDGFQVANPINRFAVGDRDPLKYNPDGSLDLVIQHSAPGAEKAANWLPAPAGAFNLAMRLYSPQPAVRDGSWVPPAVKRLE